MFFDHSPPSTFVAAAGAFAVPDYVYGTTQPRNVTQETTTVQGGNVGTGIAITGTLTNYGPG